MDEKLKLSDDALEGVAGGVSFDWGQQKSKKPLVNIEIPQNGGLVIVGDAQ